MAFEFIIERDETCKMTVLRGEGEYITRVPIGTDDSNGTVYSAFTAFSPIPGGFKGEFELIFSITEASKNGDEIGVFWDGLDTKPLLSTPEMRNLTLAVIVMSVDRLIDAAEPNVVAMSTREANLPAKAIAKYSRITGLFQKKGYLSGEGDPYHGRRIWMMRKDGIEN